MPNLPCSPYDSNHLDLIFITQQEFYNALCCFARPYSFITIKTLPVLLLFSNIVTAKISAMPSEQKLHKILTALKSGDKTYVNNYYPIYLFAYV